MARLITLLLFVLIAAAPSSYADEQADHNQLRHLKAVFEEAVNTNNLSLLEPYLAKNFSIVMYTNRKFNDFEAFKAQWDITREQMLQGGSYRVTLDPELSDLHGDIAIAQGNSTNHMVTGDGQEYQFEARWTAVLEREQGNWKLVRAHSSISPFDNELLVSTVKSKLMTWSAAAFGAGFLITSFFAWLITRRRKPKRWF
jgi:ketosteroid isomerase-like protein